jgi:hypothetical protein
MLAIVCALLASSPASAQAIVFKDEVFRAKVQKPEIIIVMTRQNLTPKYELDLDKSFLPKVVESVNRKPF